MNKIDTIIEEFEKEFWHKGVRSAVTPTGEKYFVGKLKDSKIFLQKELTQLVNEVEKEAIKKVVEDVPCEEKQVGWIGYGNGLVASIQRHKKSARDKLIKEIQQYQEEMRKKYDLN